MGRHLLIFGALLSLQFGLAQQAPPEASIAADPPPERSYVDLVRLFDYPQQAPLNVKVLRSVQTVDTTESKVQFDDPLGGRPLTIFVTEGRDSKTPAPVVIFAPIVGLNPLGTKEMRLLAGLGAVVLLVPVRAGLDANDYAGSMRHRVIEVRRVFDYLVSRGDINPERVCMIGHSWNAILAGTDPRFSCFVFLDPVMVKDVNDPDLPWFSPTSTVRQSRSEYVRQRRLEYIEAMRPFNPAPYVGHIKAPSLVQSGDKVTEGVSVYDYADIETRLKFKERAVAFYEALDGPKEYKWYEKPVLEGMGPNNRFYSAPVIKDRIKFLREQLGLGPPTRRLCTELEWPAICADARN